MVIKPIEVSHPHALKPHARFDVTLAPSQLVAEPSTWNTVVVLVVALSYAAGAGRRVVNSGPVWIGSLCWVVKIRLGRLSGGNRPLTRGFVRKS